MTTPTTGVEERRQAAVDALRVWGGGTLAHNYTDSGLGKIVDAVLSAWSAPGPQEPASLTGATAVVWSRGEPGPGRAYHLGVHYQAGRVPCLVLDVPLQRGDTLQLANAGPHPVDVWAMVRGTRLQWQANVHCTGCGTFDYHAVEVPDSTWGHPSLVQEPYVVRRCSCGNNWRQHPERA